MQKQIYWTECPRDAMQGWPNPISTQSKIEYLQALLNVGYQVLDAGSFVSPKAIPQMADSAQVFNALDTSNTKTKLLAIVANLRGTLQAVEHNNISYLGFFGIAYVSNAQYTSHP
jgi:hydroxymethylglutaryl-CoA lyase